MAERSHWPIFSCTECQKGLNNPKEINYCKPCKATFCEGCAVSHTGVFRCESCKQECCEDSRAWNTESLKGTAEEDLLLCFRCCVSRQMSRAITALSSASESTFA